MVAAGSVGRSGVSPPRCGGVGPARRRARRGARGAAQPRGRQALAGGDLPEGYATRPRGGGDTQRAAKIYALGLSVLNMAFISFSSACFWCIRKPFSLESLSQTDDPATTTTHSHRFDRPLEHARRLRSQTAFPAALRCRRRRGPGQSDFFLLRYARGTKLVFSALTKELTPKNKPPQDQRAMFSQRIESLGGESTFFEADKFAPLTKLTTFTLPSGTVFDNFLFNGNSENEQVAQGLPQEFFHMPTKGIYFSTGGNMPILVRAETAAAPTTGFALQNPNFTANDHDKSEAFRVVLGANDKKKGYDPSSRRDRPSRPSRCIRSIRRPRPSRTLPLLPRSATRIAWALEKCGLFSGQRLHRRDPCV